ncbi:MAG: efflux RND transporter periplasmic adaptor subunit [Candidatus Paceibacterota bacterium]|jgi:HlyD family secretion protein
MKNLWLKIKARPIWLWLGNFARRHKITSAIILLVVLGSGYWAYVKLTDTSGETRYVISAVAKGTIVSVVSGTGQVSAANQLAITSKVSGDLLYLGVKAGQKVSAGTLIAQIEAQDAQDSLETAQIALAKLQEPADKLTLLQAENAVTSAIESRNKAYGDAFNTVDASFLDFATVLPGLDSLFNNYNTSVYFSNESSLSDTAKAYRQTASASYYRAKTAYDKNLADYRAINRTSASSTIKSLVDETYQTAKLAAQASKETKTALSFIIDQIDTSDQTSVMTTDLANVSAWLSDSNSDVASLSSAYDNINSATRAVIDKQESLVNLQEGPEALDLRSQELAVEQKQRALNDYYIRAPFAGTIAKLDIKKNDEISNGSAIATLITDSKLADISLNEVDVSKVAVGQKVTLTFDAIEDLTISGLVSSVDQVGTVSSGVVNYDVQISFDIQDQRVLPGMSVSADIAVNARPDVLIVPSSAIKSNGDDYYVETLDQNGTVTNSQGVVSTEIPQQIIITLGLSDDTNTEVLGGLEEGDTIITQTLTSSTITKSATSLASLLGMGGKQGSSKTGSNISTSKTSSSRSSSGGDMGGPPTF